MIFLVINYIQYMKEDALKMDDNDQLSHLKEFLYGDDNDEKKLFRVPLGLQHKSLKNKINEHLEQWKSLRLKIILMAIILGWIFKIRSRKIKIISRVFRK